MLPGHNRNRNMLYRGANVTVKRNRALNYIPIYMSKFYTELQRQLLAVLRLSMARSPILIMVFIPRGNWHQAKHSCRLDASDRAAGDILHIPPSAPTAVNACL
eukprot:1868838-Pleurochrysis_carterae.AAC.1